MAHHNTVFAQLLKLVPRHEFEGLAREHHQGRRLRKMSRRSQFIALTLAQLSGRSSLRDIVGNLAAQSRKLYHLGSRTVSRSSLARVNEQQPAQLYEALFNKLLARCQSLAPGHGFRFKNKLYSLDASTIDLCLEMFPWARFRTTKGAIKLHVDIDHGGYLPSFVSITDGKVHDVTAASICFAVTAGFTVGRSGSCRNFSDHYALPVGAHRRERCDCFSSAQFSICNSETDRCCQ